jgi:hypothetical protein
MYERLKNPSGRANCRGSRNVTVNYFCRGGRLDSGHYVFQAQGLDDAVESYRQLHEELVKIYGPPFVDNTPWPVSGVPKEPRSIESDARNYLTSWRVGHLRVSASTKQIAAPANSGWRAVIVFRKLPGQAEARPNTSLERTRER